MLLGEICLYSQEQGYGVLHRRVNPDTLPGPWFCSRRSTEVRPPIGREFCPRLILF